MDLGGVHLASGASSKGLAAYAGLALVFADHELAVSESIPPYLDLGRYDAHAGVPYTHSSNLVRALAAAVGRFDASGGAVREFAHRAERCMWLRDELEARGYVIMAPRACASPAVLTLVLPAEQSSVEFGEALERDRIYLSYRSAYLVERNLIQISLRGETTEAELRYLLGRMWVGPGGRRE